VVITITYSILLSFSNGFGLNLVASEQVPVYISEITPKNLRGGFATVNQVLPGQGRVHCWMFRALS